LRYKESSTHSDAIARHTPP